MRSCDRYREALSARLDGEDPGLPVEMIDAHAAGCADCRAWAAAAGRLSAGVGIGDVPAPSPVVMNELLDRAGGPEQRPSPGNLADGRPEVNWRARIVIGSIVAAVVVVVLLLLGR